MSLRSDENAGYPSAEFWQRSDVLLALKPYVPGQSGDSVTMTLPPKFRDMISAVPSWTLLHNGSSDAPVITFDGKTVRFDQSLWMTRGVLPNIANFMACADSTNWWKDRLSEITIDVVEPDVAERIAIEKRNESETSLVSLGSSTQFEHQSTGGSVVLGAAEAGVGVVVGVGAVALFPLVGAVAIVGIGLVAAADGIRRVVTASAHTKK